MAEVQRWAAPDAVVVTGAAGWLGRALVHDLATDPDVARRPERIVALVHHPDEVTAVERAAGGPVRTVVGDIAEPASLPPLFDGLGSSVVDVIHTAGVIHPSRLADFERVNVIGTANVVEAALMAGARRLVHVSSNSPFGTNPDRDDTFRGDEPYHPYLAYGASKMRGELAVLDAVADRGLDATIVRPPWFYGPWQPARQTTFFRMVRAGRFPVFGDGDQRRSMVYVGNLVHGIRLAELTPGAAGRGYWVADARPYTVAEIVATVASALRAEGLEVAEHSLRLPNLFATGARAVDAALQRVGVYQQQLHVLGEMGTTIACDITSTRDELGYEPAVDLSEGMRRSIRWCLDQGVEL